MNDNTSFGPAASEYFYSAVNDYLRGDGYNEIRWADWLDIRGTWKSGDRVDAIKMLRTLVVREVEQNIEACVRPEHPFSAFMVARARKIVVERLSLTTSKIILDWLQDEYCLDPK